MTDDFTAGYTLGYATGYDVGHAHGVTEESAAWTSVLTGCTDTWRQPRREEVLRAREVDHQPCPTKCRTCSACFHSLSWYERGGRPYLGVQAERARAAS